MQIAVRDPDKGYLSSELWVPKSAINVDGLKNTLTLPVSKKKGEDSVVFLWKESTHHIIIPREFFNYADIVDQFETVDIRPQEYTYADIRSKVILDFRSPEETIQRECFDAMMRSRGGIVQLACVSGDTVLNINRSKAGKKVTIAQLYKKLHGKNTSTDLSIPTYIRAKKESGIGLHLVEDVVYRGLRQTYELTTEDGKKLRLTRDHQVLTPSGFRSIDEGLSVGSEVLVDSGQTKGESRPSGRKKKPIYRRLHWYPSHPYAHKSSIKRGPRSGTKQQYCLEEHRAVAEAALNKLTLEQYRERCRSGDVAGLLFIGPKKFHVHHKDENVKNNNIDNLEVLKRADHGREHGDAKHFSFGEVKATRITELRSHGVEDVYDVVCADPHHNFVANGIVVHNCGKGKTVISLHVAASLKMPTLIVVDTTQLLDQWQGEIADHLDVPGGVGIFQAQNIDWKKPIVLATYSTLVNWVGKLPAGMREWFGTIIFDEAHHLGAETFSKTAALFPGRRYALTATVERQDGTHVVYRAHVGPVLYKNLKADLHPEVFFYQTGIGIDMANMAEVAEVVDVNGEVHHGLLSGFLGRKRDRLEMIIGETRKAVAEGRRVLVLSYSLDELINLLALWQGAPQLLTELDKPTLQDIGETIQPAEMTEVQLKKMQISYGRAADELKKNKDPAKEAQIRFLRDQCWGRLEAHRVAVKLDKEWERRKLTFLRELTKQDCDAGIMIRAVKVKERTHTLKTKQVVFAIMKYGREALNQPLLDSVLVCEPIAQEGSMRQILGRILRKKSGKKTPIAVFFQDNVGTIHGMCAKLKRFMKHMPQEDGGPIDFKTILHDPNGNLWKHYS